MEAELILTDEFKEKVKAFKQDWYQKLSNIGLERTPEFDASGKKIVNTRPDGYDYIEESYMRNALDKHFPGWSWEMASPLHFLGAEWVVAQGHLCIIDESLLAFNVIPPIRRFFGVDSVRVQYRTCKCKNSNKGKPVVDCIYCKGTGNLPHTPDNIVDVGDNCKQANTAAMKYAISRLTHIGDDIYGKRLEMNGAGSLEDVAIATESPIMFSKWVQEEMKISWSEVKTILSVTDIGSILDIKDAITKIKQAKGKS